MGQKSTASALNAAGIIDSIVSKFGKAVTRKLLTRQGSPEDHLRAPFEKLLADMAKSLGLSIVIIGETRLPDLSIRPDYAVDVAGSRVGYVELKRPGHGVPTTWRNPSGRDRSQWEKLQYLPNVLYCDGEQFARYRFGKLQGKVARLSPPLDSAGSRLQAVGSDFERVLTDFFLWEPERPRTLDELVNLIANLCRLLREDVVAEITREQSGESLSQTFSGLATDWRQILFPNLSDAAFADQYSQTVTFALLLARVDGISFQGRSISEIARLLGKKHSLMGRALTVLTDQPEEEHSVALTTMVRVLSAVDWSAFPDNSYAMLYENFLTKYDPALRRKSGVYYTPSDLVSFMARFVDNLLQIRMNRNLGFAERDVIVVDPAMGTGSFLAEIVNIVASTIGREEGDGAVPSHLRELSNRIIGFENQAAPYAVAELRIHTLLRKRHRADVPAEERRFLANALDDPDLQILPIGRMYEAIERSRRGANHVKREEPVMVVIGNPPYRDKAKGSAAWIETADSTSSSPSLSAFRKPGNGGLEFVLSNLYVYFWRWATWKVFDAHPAHPAGVVAFVCSAGFTTGRGFVGFREYLRRTTDEGWIIDLTPEGHQPPMNTRFFRGNQQPICIAIFIRRGDARPGERAHIHYTAVTGSVNDKVKALQSLRVDDASWQDCPGGWGDTFRPQVRDPWNAMPSMTDLMPWSVPGIKPNRTWVYAPELDTLRSRWTQLVNAAMRDKAVLLKETESTKINSNIAQVAGMVQHAGPISMEDGNCPEPRRIAYRAFDRKWVIPDARLHHRPSPTLWSTNSESQIYIVEHAHPIANGPALLFTALIPDMDYHSGFGGGRVRPLFRNVKGTVANISPGLLSFLSREILSDIAALDLVAYFAAISAHPGFVRRFAKELKVPGVRMPLTRDARLWHKAIALGKQVLWLHTYGERCSDVGSGRLPQAPKLAKNPPKVLVAIPDIEDQMPERLAYDHETQTLHVGSGRIAPVSPEVFNYSVNGMMILKHWFGYRKRKPSGVQGSPLCEISAKRWTSTMTTELLELLNVLGACVSLEPQQEALLVQVMDSSLISIDDLTAAGVLPIPDNAKQPPKSSRYQHLFDNDEMDS
ncbi:type ISP restriction/modification enzyme [Nocardia sp. NPDC050175]|uniref:type ISP restriction/modification enzyme n=1 Tax=Nocardia sp. NPDC050175 TaxID=3364317 RepID=UPI00379881CB